MSSTSRYRIGDVADRMVADLQTLFADIAPDGLVTEIVQSTAILARREAWVAR